MSDYMGDFAVNATVNIFFTTHDKTGGAIAPLTAFEAADVVLYKGNSATQRSSTAGWTMTSPFDSIVGLHLLSIDTSDNTDAGFYAAGSEYTAVLSPDTETVDGKTVVRVLATFSIARVLAATHGNLTAVKGTALPAESVGGRDAAALGKFLDVATPALDCTTTVQVGAQAALEANNLDHLVGTATGIPALPAGTFLDARTLAAAGYFDPTTDTVLLGNGAHGGAAATFQFVSGSSGIITGSLSGSVGSVAGNVTGSVGSVAGNVTGSVGSVAGNVTGSVGSVAGNVTGSVGSVAGNVTGSVGSLVTWANGATFTAIPWNAALTVGAQAADTAAMIALGYTAPVAAFIDVAISSRLAAAAYTVPPGTAAIAGAVDAALIVSHGAGAWNVTYEED